MNEPWYIFGPRNAGGRSTQLQPAQVPGQVQAAPVVNNITYNTAPATDGGVTDAGGALGDMPTYQAPHGAGAASFYERLMHPQQFGGSFGA